MEAPITPPSEPPIPERQRSWPSRLVRAAAVGAVAGLIATLAMSLIMLPARWVGLLGTQPPRRISDELIGAAKGRAWVPESERRRGTALVHLGIGAVGGAGYALGREAVGRRFPASLVGLGFGATLWAFNYIVAAPALDLFPPPWKDRAGRPPVMLAANALFGLVTAMLVDRADAGDRTDGPLARPSKPQPAGIEAPVPHRLSRSRFAAYRHAMKEASHA